MKTKKYLALLLALALSAALLLSGCGGRSQSADSGSYAVNGASAPAYREDYDEYDYEETYTAEAATGSVAELIGSAAQVQISDTEKMIYTAYATVETLEFEKTTAAVQELLGRYDAYLESSSVTGTSYSYGRSTRSAEYTLRVPVQNYTAMSTSLTELGNVTNYSSDAENITSRYVDTEARLQTYRTEHDRLIEMLSAAEDVESMIYIESRLSEVEYQIESLTSTLRDWQGRVDYSTIHLSIQEVRQLTDTTPEPETFGERILSALSDSVEWLGEAAQGIVIALVAILPWLVVPAIVVIVIVVLVKRSRRKKRLAAQAAYEKEAAEAAERAKAYAAAQAEKGDT